MKKVFIIAASLALAVTALAQNLPDTWRKGSATLPLSSADTLKIQQGGKDKTVAASDFSQANGKHFSLVITGVNMKTTGATTLLTVPAGMTFICTGVKVESTAVTALTVGSAWTLGSTGTAANSLVASTTGSTSATTGTFESFTPKANASVIAAADVVQFTIATASTATTHTANIHLSGYFR